MTTLIVMLAVAVLAIEVESASAVLGFLAFAAYFLGYSYCRTLWDIERNDSVFDEAIQELDGAAVEE